MTLGFKAAFASFSVGDARAALAFYRDTLGADIREEPMGLVLRAGGGEVFIYEKADHVPATFTVLNFMVDDIERAFVDLKVAGVTFEVYDGDDIRTDARGIAADDDMKIAWFKDPAGNFLSIIEEGG